MRLRVPVKRLKLSSLLLLSSINGSKKSDFILCGGMFRDYGVFAGSESFSHWDN